jgi:hypothetical protein
MSGVKEPNVFPVNFPPASRIRYTVSASFYICCTSSTLFIFSSLRFVSLTLLGRVEHRLTAKSVAVHLNQTVGRHSKHPVSKGVGNDCEAVVKPFLSRCEQMVHGVRDIRQVGVAQ